MLQIRLSKPATDAGGSVKPGPTESVNVACPGHLVLADLPVAKSLGTPFAGAVVKNVGRRSRRQLGERVHICVQCEFPIAIYGRLSPCEHAFCLDCARSDFVCYLCHERIQKIQTIKMMEGLFICAAPHCLKSFLKKSDFEFHINEKHADLLRHGKEKEGNDFEATSSRKLSASDSTVQTPARSVFSPGSKSQNQDYDEKSQRGQVIEQQNPRSSLQMKPSQPFSTQFPNHPYAQHPDISQYQVPDRATYGSFPPQSFVPNSVNQNPTVPPHQYPYGLYSSDVAQHYGGAPHDLSRSDPVTEAAQGQGPLSSYQHGPSGHSMNVAQNYPQNWNLGPTSKGLEPPLASQSANTLPFDPQGKGFFAMDYAQNMEPRQGGRTVDPREGNRVHPLTRHPLPSLPQPYLVQTQRGRSFPSDGIHDAPPGFGWQPERRDSFGHELD